MEKVVMTWGLQGITILLNICQTEQGDISARGEENTRYQKVGSLISNFKVDKV